MMIETYEGQKETIENCDKDMEAICFGAGHDGCVEMLALEPHKTTITLRHASHTTRAWLPSTPPREPNRLCRVDLGS